ncbi:hypothetical protein [Nocardioides limicola]|uniref:hypothetical protein n=1 Tax=Nocardioides limicola TaxID=2803368 RepID=UPI00193BD07C|nr:hypothetical protein [Nocardioides sp. DJM-14]
MRTRGRIAQWGAAGALTIAVAIVASPAPAAAPVETIEFSVDSLHDWESDGLPQFDPTRGTLLGAEVTVEVEMVAEGETDPDDGLLAGGLYIERWSESITDPAGLADFVGTGSVTFDLAGPDAVAGFVPSGQGLATVVYSYVPAAVAGQVNAQAAVLPSTGGPGVGLLVAALLLLVAGTAIVGRVRPVD